MEALLCYGMSICRVHGWTLWTSRIKCTKIWDQLDEDRYDFYETNAYSATALRTLGKKKYHVIIDDGSHHPKDILFVADHYYHLLEPGGVMILEDIPNEQLITRANQFV